MFDKRLTELFGGIRVLGLSDFQTPQLLFFEKGYLYLAFPSTKGLTTDSRFLQLGPNEFYRGFLFKEQKWDLLDHRPNHCVTCTYAMQAAGDSMKDAFGTRQQMIDAFYRYLKAFPAAKKTGLIESIQRTNQSVDIEAIA